MDKRKEELTKLKSYTERVDNNLTMILQSLHWDRKNLSQAPVLGTCRYDSNHRIPPGKTEEHERGCFLRENGYTKEDQLLPDPLDAESNTLVKLRNEDIQEIIANAARADTTFKKVYRELMVVPFWHMLCLIACKRMYIYYPMGFLNKGVGCHGAEPMSLERLQICYSADERRVIHDAVVSAVPSCHDLADLALLSDSNEQGSKVILTRKEILLELRNMRRRRTKYRVAPKTRNYSDVLRDVIRTQMEVYNDGKIEETTSKETVDQNNSQGDMSYGRTSDSHNTDRNRDLHNDNRNRDYLHNDNRNRSNLHNNNRSRGNLHNDNRNRYDSHSDDRNRHELSKKWVPPPIQVKTEREEPVGSDRIDNRRRSRRDSYENERHRQEPKKWVPRPIQVEIKTERDDATYRYPRADRRHSQCDSKHDNRHRNEHSKNVVPRPIKVEVKTDIEGSRRRERSSESRHSGRNSDNDSEDRYERNEYSVPRPIKEKNKSERVGSTERHRSADRRYSSQDLESVPRPIKEEVKSGREETETTTEHRRERSHKANRDDVSGVDKRDRNSRRDHSPRGSRYYEENDQERTQKYGDHSRKKRSDHGYEECSNTGERQNYYDDGEYQSKKRHKRSHRHDSYEVESERRKETQLDEESHGYHGAHREKRDGRRKDNDRKRKDKHTHRHYENSGRRHREEGHDHGQETSDRIRIKQERADSVTLRDARDRCDDETYRARNRGHRRYYDDSDTQDVYNPNKKIKTEK